MATIPASAVVNVLPSVLNAGGNSLFLNGLVLTSSTRVPIGTVQSFPAASNVSSYFGQTATETLGSTVYFNGYANSTQKPGALLFAQYNSTAVPAYLRSGNITAVGLSGLQVMSGTLTVNMDGYARTAGALSLAAATSFSSAATLIQTALNATPVVAATVTGSIAISTATITGSLNDFILIVTAASGAAIVPGTVITGAGIVAGTRITSQLTGTAGGIGTYAFTASAPQTIASEAITGTYGTMTVTAVASGTLSVGQTMSGGTTTAGTLITGLGTGTGLTGTYFVTPSQTVVSAALTASSTPLTVTFDSISGAFIVQSAVLGAASTAAFATGTLSASLLMTSVTGAVLSPGAEAATPSAFMTAVSGLTQNWATFLTAFDPDFGTGNSQKLAFAAWASGQNSRYAFLCTDTDISPTQSTSAINSLGYLIGPNGNNYAGTCLIYDPNVTYLAYLAAGYAASLDFGATNGRTTAAFRSQPGIQASVTNQTAEANLIANGYNLYGAFATANQSFLWFYPGSISGPFQWLDSYVNQIWLNSQLQLALMELLQNIPSIPYNAAGYAMIEAACLDPINAGLNFGAFRTGVPLSQAQIIEVNNQAGANIAPILTVQGWYFQVQPASPQVRQARLTPPIFFFYVDGQSVQQITINSIDVQ